MDIQQGQTELRFEAGTSPNGYQTWQEQRRASLRQLASQLGLPIGHDVEVWLRDGIVLKGKLRLREELIWIDEERNNHIELVIGRIFLCSLGY